MRHRHRTIERAGGVGKGERPTALMIEGRMDTYCWGTSAQTPIPRPKPLLDRPVDNVAIKMFSIKDISLIEKHLGRRYEDRARRLLQKAGRLYNKVQ